MPRCLWLCAHDCVQVSDVVFRLDGKEVRFSNQGVCVNIIDFTLSRLEAVRSAL